MKDQLLRIKELITYRFDGSFLTEEMKTSDYFRGNNFQKDQETRYVSMEVGVDTENNMEYRIALVMRFTNISGYDELVFYFSLLDKNNQFVKGKESIYDRNVVNQYLPKELQKSISFFGKLKEMFKILIKMEKPIRFFIETYEDYKNEKLINAYNPIIDLILKNGYMLKDKGVSHDKKKYYWEFVQATKQILPEGYESFDYSKVKKDDEYWKKFNEETRVIFEKMYPQKETL